MSRASIRPEPSPPPAPAPEPTPAPTPAPVVDDTPPPSSAVGSIPERPATRGGSPWYKDVLGDALVVSGIAAGAVSIVMYTKARSELDDAEAAPSLDGYKDLVAQAHDHRTYAVILAGACGTPKSSLTSADFPDRARRIKKVGVVVAEAQIMNLGAGGAAALNAEASERCNSCTAVHDSQQRYSVRAQERSSC